MSERNAEYRGYLAGCQGLDDLIHVISSQQHYAFNLKWIKTPPPPPTSAPLALIPVTETFTGPQSSTDPKAFDNPGWVPYHSHDGRFNGKGQYTIDSKTHHNGINRVVGKGSFEATLDVTRLQFYQRTERVSEGFTIWIKDDRARVMALSIKEDNIKLGVRDTQPQTPMPGARYRGDRGWILENTQAKYKIVPTSVRLRFTYNQEYRRWRIFYTFDPDSSPNIELPQSKAGLYFGKQFTESTVLYILMSNGQADLDNFKIKHL